MPIDTFSDHLAGGDTGRWQAAVRRAAGFGWQPPRALPDSGWHPSWHQPGSDADREIPLTTAALLVYAIAADTGTSPDTVTLADVGAWFTAVRHARPAMPEPRVWDVVVAQDPSYRLETMLRAAGHDLPLLPPGETPDSADPVVAAWLLLMSSVQPPPEWLGSLFDPGPYLERGLTAVEQAATAGTPA